MDDEYKGYVLSKSEEQEFRECVEINEDLYRRSQRFAVARSITLGKLLLNAKKEGDSTVAPGAGVDRDMFVRTTKFTLADGRTALLEELLLALDAPGPIMRRVRLGGDIYIVDAKTEILKADRGRRIFDPSEENPFAKL